MVEVVAAIIREGDKLLICRRPAHKARGLLWEFPGGKIEKGETAENALVRECREELDVKIRVNGAVAEATHEYPDITVHITFFDAEITEGEVKALEHAEIRNVKREELPSYPFCPADEEIIKTLASQKG